MATGERVLQELQQGDKTVRVVEPAEVLEVYSDGTATAQISGAVTKVSFVTTLPGEVGDSAKVEVRRINLRLIMPTRQIAETCKMILSQMQANSERVAAAYDNEKTAIINILKGS
jgi:hypothetical protein